MCRVCMRPCAGGRSRGCDVECREVEDGRACIEGRVSVMLVGDGLVFVNDGWWWRG